MKSRRSTKKQKDGWNTLQEWSTKVSRWKTWKKVALCMIGIFILFVLGAMVTTPHRQLESIQRPVLLGSLFDLVHSS